MKLKLIFFFLTLLSSIVLSFTAKAQYMSLKETSSGKPVSRYQTFDIGNVAVGSSKDLSFAITNTDIGISSFLIIDAIVDVASPSLLSSLPPLPATIQPQQGAEFFTIHFAPIAVGNVTDTIRIACSDPAGWFVFYVTGHGVAHVDVTGITVTGAGNATTITTSGGTLQMSAAVLPANATNKTVTWSVVNGTGSATINASGLLTATGNGTVTVKATATDGSGIVGSTVITISNQVVLVTGIIVTGAGNATTITTSGGTLQMSAAVLPANATNKTVTWSVVNGTGTATINASGLLTATGNGTVTVKATATDGSAVVGSTVITISNQVVLVTGITVTGAGNATTITTSGGTLQMSAAVLPANATNKTVTWSVVNGTGTATINTSGLLTATGNGTVTVTATANDGSGISGSEDIQICALNKPTITLDFSNPEGPVLTSSSPTGNQWFLNGNAISGATLSTYTVAQPGSYTTQITQGTCISAMSDQIQIVITGLEKEIIQKFYPNPASKEITMNTIETGLLSIQIFDMLGKSIKQFSYSHGGEITIDITDLAQGSYILIASQENNIQRIHFIKN